MKKFIIAFIIIFSILSSQETSYGDAFLNIGASSRSVGLGRSVVALPQNVGGYLINPAATAFLSNNTFTGMYVNQFGLAEYYTLGFSHPTKNDYHWGIHGLNLSVNDIFERPMIQLITGVGYSQIFDHIPEKYTLLLQKNSLYKNETQYGAELTLFNLINVRGGFNYGYLQGGVGLTIGNTKYTFDLDYSFSNHDLGNAHGIGGTIYL